MSPGGLSQALARISHWLSVERAVLLEAVRGSPQLHVDETGWRLDWNNNRAERMIRPNVIYRNRSYGNRSDRGAEAHGTLMSLMQTLRLQGKNVGENLRTAFLKHRQGDASPQLSFAV